MIHTFMLPYGKFALKSTRTTAILLAFLFLFQAALFWPVTTEFFTPDAVYYLARQLDGWGDIRTVFTALDDVANYRPLTYLVTTAMYSRWKLDPFPYHVFTVLAHVGITALVFWLARLLLSSDIAGFFAALFFGLHSAASRVAFGITFISDLLYAAFFIFAIIAFVKFHRGYGRHWIVLSLSSFLLSLLSKEPAATLPAVLTGTLLLVPLRNGEKPLKWKECVRGTLPFWILCFIYLGWFAFLSDGRFVPQEPAHPYHVSLTWENFRSKAQYLTLALNLGRFSTFADHPTIAAAAARLLPSGVAEVFSRGSDFWLYLIGPVWMLWLVVKGEWQVLSEVAVFALATPFVVISSFVVLRSLFGRKTNGDPWTGLYGLLLFVLPLLPVLILPPDKTMLHNLYVPTVGLGMIVGAFVRVRAQQDSRRLKRFMAPCVLAIVVAAGIHYISFSIESGWPTTTARAASKYLMDIQYFRSTFPKGSILYFERTGMPDWPFLTRGGDLFRVFYQDETLVTMFGDYGQAAPSNEDSGRTVFRFREINGSLLPSAN